MKASYGGKTFQFEGFDELWRFYRHILGTCSEHLGNNQAIKIEKSLRS